GLIFFPPSGIHLECLIPSEQTFDGGWKGVGNLYHINIPDDFLLNAVVSFPRPKPSAYVFEGYFAFLKDVHLMHSDSRNQKG
ncbi:MAG: DUF427 domain-containing protein, partial [Bdellovibrionales bacterium]|nr:DUF427 domain-containing protein [Bdellovibrionales bacterium]